MRALELVSPALAAEVVSRLFLRTPRRLPSRHRLPSIGRPTIRRVAGLRVDEWGHGPAVLLVHGWGGRGSQLRHFVPTLLAAGHRVVTFDAPGHGDSPGASLSLPEFARAILRVAADLGPLAAIVAHSFGGPATALAIRGGLAVGRLALIGPPADERRWFTEWSKHLGISETTQAIAEHLLVDLVGARFEDFAPEVLSPALDLPLLVVHDRDDREVPYADAERIVATAPRAELYTTTGLGHRRILKAPQVLEKVAAFVRAAATTADGLGRCRGCGGSTVEAWDTEGKLCVSCGVDAMLADRGARWRLPRA